MAATARTKLPVIKALVDRHPDEQKSPALVAAYRSFRNGFGHQLRRLVKDAGSQQSRQPPLSYLRMVAAEPFQPG